MSKLQHATLLLAGQRLTKRGLMAHFHIGVHSLPAVLPIACCTRASKPPAGLSTTLHCKNCFTFRPAVRARGTPGPLTVSSLMAMAYGLTKRRDPPHSPSVPYATLYLLLHRPGPLLGRPASSKLLLRRVRSPHREQRHATRAGLCPGEQCGPARPRQRVRPLHPERSLCRTRRLGRRRARACRLGRRPPDEPAGRLRQRRDAPHRGL